MQNAQYTAQQAVQVWDGSGGAVSSVEAQALQATHPPVNVNVNLHRTWVGAGIHLSRPASAHIVTIHSISELPMFMAVPGMLPL